MGFPITDPLKKNILYISDTSFVKIPQVVLELRGNPVGTDDKKTLLYIQTAKIITQILLCHIWVKKMSCSMALQKWKLTKHRTPLISQREN